jgi:lipid II:glycine glycyltransferase (peptidoglycan interpeptide bridge formation enzyme)
VELALPASPETLWSSFDSKLRAKIPPPEKEGMETALGRHPSSLFESIIDTFRESASIVVLRLQQKPVAAAFLLGFKKRLEIPWASSIGEFNRLKVNMLLYWMALRKAIQDGYEIFDFGRCTIDAGATSRNSGAHKKSSFIGIIG